jgi:hypothetical protein
MFLLNVEQQLAAWLRKQIRAALSLKRPHTGKKGMTKEERSEAVHLADTLLQEAKAHRCMQTMFCNHQSPTRLYYQGLIVQHMPLARTVQMARCVLNRRCKANDARTTRDGTVDICTRVPCNGKNR